MTTHPTSSMTNARGAHRTAWRGIPLGVVLFGILAGQAIVLWIGYSVLRAF